VSIDINGNKRWGIPAELVPVMCWVTGDYEMLYIITELQTQGNARQRGNTRQDRHSKKDNAGAARIKELEKALLGGK
jgi:hypothetical protein